MKFLLLLLFLFPGLMTGVLGFQGDLSAQKRDLPGLKVNAHEYLEMPGLNVMVFYDIYPEGHQGGVGIIQNGTRVATNGDLRLGSTPGQWQPIPKVGKRTVVSDREVAVRCWYPDSALNRKGFNPVIYPDLSFVYSVRVVAEGTKFRILVDLDQPLPPEWEKEVGFNLELFPGLLFGKSWYLDGAHGLFNRQPTGPVEGVVVSGQQATGLVKSGVALTGQAANQVDRGAEGGRQRSGQAESGDGGGQGYAFGDGSHEKVFSRMATGEKLTIAPEEPAQRMRIESFGEPLQLLDGRVYHNNGWFVVRSLVTPGKTKGAVEWLVDANVLPGFVSPPVVHVSQVGYHPAQEKVAVVELDGSVETAGAASLIRYGEDGETQVIKEVVPAKWGKYLRFNYFRFDFSEVKREGVYRVTYGDRLTEPFRIGAGIYDRDVWQPTVEYFLPVQMCHMRINEGYRVWHDLCHMDDALMAPVDTNHFDGYLQGPSTLTKYKSGQQVPGLNTGGWHDAGDYDLRVESQAGTVWVLAMAQEQFSPAWDQTTIDQQKRLVEIHRPDGKDDILQQIEHGLLTILGGYENLGRLYRGIICNSLRQYVMLGDAASMTDGLKYNPALGEDQKTGIESGITDDRWVFTEENPGREIEVARALAAASRVMKGYNDTLAVRALGAAEALYDGISGGPAGGINPRMASGKVKAAIELLLATGNAKYRKDILDLATDRLLRDNDVTAHLGRVLPLVKDAGLESRALVAARAYREEVDKLKGENPFGVPYKPHIWGDGWNIQSFGVRQYFLQKYYPSVFDGTVMLNALNFILGNHPGENTSSFVSGVGSRSVTVAYGVNRADWSYIPGGSVSGTGIIRPDFPELKGWPYFWQQTEYVMGGGATNFMFLVLAARERLRD